MIKTSAKPFLKWAGGKTQLLSKIDNAIQGCITQTNFTYIEPFIGGGAVLFWILQKYPNIKKAVINDINTDLVRSYIIIKVKLNFNIKIMETAILFARILEIKNTGKIISLKAYNMLRLNKIYLHRQKL